MSRRKKKNGGLLGLVIGAFAAVGAAIFLSKKENRTKVTKVAKKTATTAKKTAKKVRTAANKAKADAKRKISKGKKKIARKRK